MGTNHQRWEVAQVVGWSIFCKESLLKNIQTNCSDDFGTDNAFSD